MLLPKTASADLRLTGQTPRISGWRASKVWPSRYTSWPGDFSEIYWVSNPVRLETPMAGLLSLLAENLLDHSDEMVDVANDEHAPTPLDQPCPG